MIAYAAARNIEVIPEIDVPGHSKALVASYPELFCFDGETDANFELRLVEKRPITPFVQEKKPPMLF